MDKKELIDNINKLRVEKNAVIMAHYYQRDEIQEIADFIGDSLALAQKAAQTTADIIVICGVHFMGETAKIICPDKTVLIPDKNAGCSLADSCKFADLKAWKNEHPDYKVISYVNTSAEVKSLTDIVVTSSNALKIVNQLPKEEKILFGPDQNLGGYINKMKGRNMALWNGACHVHSRFDAAKLSELKKQYPEAKVLAHPECKSEVLDLADEIGSTQALLNFAKKSDAKQFIVVTECGILYEMQKACPDKEFIPLPSETGEKCNECEYMRMCTLENLYECLLTENNKIEVNEEISKKAVVCINKMLNMSK